MPLTGGLHPISPLLNLVAVPWLALFLLASFLWLLAAWLSTSLGALLLPLLDALATPLESLAALPPSGMFLRAPDLATALLWLFVAAALWIGRSLPRGGLAVLALWLLLAVGHRDGAGDPGGDDPDAELTLLDVGQGDAILIRDRSAAVLVDGGGWPDGDLGGRVLLPALAAAGIDRLAAVILTHPDSDHCSGLIDLSRYLPVGELWMLAGWSGDPCAANLLAAPGMRWRPLWRGRRAMLDAGDSPSSIRRREPGAAATTARWC